MNNPSKFSKHTTADRKENHVLYAGEESDIRLSGVISICFLISFLYLLFCTKSSPLYPFNDWVDANAFFTMGKGMMHGLVPYRDLFEQKGPLLYFVYGLASLISYRTFIGGFIFEVVAFSFFLFFSFKSLSLFVEKRIVLLLLPVIALLVLNLKAFTHGGSAEELCLPLLAISLYHLLRYLKSDDPATATLQTFFWNGLIAGCILWVKFSMLGFWLGWIITLFVILLVQKCPKQALMGVAVFLGGMLVATIPWIIYFGVNHAIPDWMNTYFVVNLTGYSHDLTLTARLTNVIGFLVTLFTINPIFGVLLWLGMVSFLVFKKFLTKIYNRIALFGCFSILAVGIYWGGIGWVYYYLILTPFIVFGLIVTIDAVKWPSIGEISIQTTVKVIAVILIISIPLEFKFGQNSYLLSFRQQDLVQYKFAEIINRSPNAKLLNYGSLDLGFYTTAGINPSFKYFELQNLSYSRYPANIDEQKRYIREGVPDFVVLLDYEEFKNSSLYPPRLDFNYHLVSTQEQISEGEILKYSLYQINER